MRDHEVIAAVAAAPSTDSYSMRIRRAFRELAEMHRADGQETPFCEECGFTWPCRTRRVIDAAEGLDSSASCEEGRHG